MYLIVITATGNGPLPIISLIMLAITYGLQVSAVGLRIWNYLTFVRSGYYFPTETRVHAHRMDDHLFGCVGVLLYSVMP